MLRAPFLRRSFALNAAQRGLEFPQMIAPITDVTAFLAGLRFEHRDKLFEYPSPELVKTPLESRVINPTYLYAFYIST